MTKRFQNQPATKQGRGVWEKAATSVRAGHKRKALEMAHSETRGISVVFEAFLARSRKS